MNIVRGTALRDCPEGTVFSDINFLSPENIYGDYIFMKDETYYLDRSLGDFNTTNVGLILADGKGLTLISDDINKTFDLERPFNVLKYLNFAEYRSRWGYINERSEFFVYSTNDLMEITKHVLLGNLIMSHDI